ncbi:MAG TPA: GNAT family N-acetyltransferase [Nitrospira sp.]|nr:GNAT family N-acetyltransferase [Nitrospira sp.]
MKQPAIIQALLQRRRYDERSLPTVLWHAVRNRVWYRREKRIYVYEAERIQHVPDSFLLQRNRLEDLRYYERTVSWQMSPDAYQQEARLRLAKGEHLYTLVDQGRLVHYAWLATHHVRGEDRTVGQVFFAPPDSAALYDHYTHPLARRRGLYFKALCQLLHDVPVLTKAKRAYIYVYADNSPSRHVIEKIGFRYVGSLVEERRLLAVRRFPVSAGGEFRTALLEESRQEHRLLTAKGP